LRKVATYMVNKIKKRDSVFRSGGNNFAVILPNMKLKKAARSTDKIRDGISTLDVSIVNSEQTTLNIMLSAGVASFPKDGRSRKKLIEIAESRLLKAKSYGRNQICPRKKLKKSR